MPDALTAAQAGFDAIGLLGAQTPDDAVAARLANHAANQHSRLVLVCDPDVAGRRVADTLGPLLEELNHRPDVITPPDGLDLNDWANRHPDWSVALLGETQSSWWMERDAAAREQVEL